MDDFHSNDDMNPIHGHGGTVPPENDVKCIWKLLENLSHCSRPASDLEWEGERGREEEGERDCERLRERDVYFMETQGVQAYSG